MSSLPAGWYKDPADTTTQRYWDGDGWVGKAIPADAVPPDGPPPAEQEPPPPAAPAPVAPAPAAAPGGWMQPPQQQQPQQPQQAPPGWGPTPPPPPGWQPPAGWQQPPPHQQQPPPHQQPQQGWQQPQQGWQQPPPGWQQPPPGWQPQGMRTAAFPFPIQARPHGYALADLGRRLGARVIDIVAVLLLNVVVNGYFAYQWYKEFLPTYRQMMDQIGNGRSAFDVQESPRVSELLWVMLIVATLIWLAYEAPATAAGGQTLGKRIMRIKVMALDSTEPIGFGRAFGRWARLGLWTPAWGCVGFGLIMQLIDSLSPTFDPMLRQAFHDKSAGTVVVALPAAGEPGPVNEATSSQDLPTTPPTTGKQTEGRPR